MLSNVGLEAKVSALISKSKEQSVSNSDLMELLELMKELEDRDEYSGFHKLFRSDTPYSLANLPKHKAFMDATKKYRELLLLGGNRSGKTTLGGYISSVLATGQYPDDWDGIRFDGPVNIWACGKTAQTTRDTVQVALLGASGNLGTGMLPKNCIGKSVRLSGVPGAVDIVEVLHTSGKWSTIGFKAYKQDTPSFYGTAKHLVWLDEPCPEDIYNECLIRTAVLGDRPDGSKIEGRLIHTITPKEGLTRLLADFLASCDLLEGTQRITGIDKAVALMRMEDGSLGDALEALKAPIRRANHRATIAIGWDDIPWMSDDTKTQILESTPPHLRETVSQGIPSIGDGAVYQVPLSALLLKQEDCFQIPPHYKKIFGMDVGWNRTAAVFGAIDPDTDVLYIYGEHYLAHQPPEVHAQRIKDIAGDWMVGAIDPAANITGTDGKTLMTTYRRLGLRLREADNAVESGIMRVESRMLSGKLKIFQHTTPNLQNEYLIYRRDDGKIHKEDDHAMDALRYLVSKIELARPTPLSDPSLMGINRAPATRRYNV